MRISFLMPSYPWGPSGGCRVVYEYANRLASRGHDISVVHPRHLKYLPPERLTPYLWARGKAISLWNLLSKPRIDWQPIDRRVRLLYIPTSDSRLIPDADAIFATSWHTVRSVLKCPPAKGEKCYLIQHYEVWQGSKELVDATWRSPLHKVVVAKWLADLGGELGCHDITYIPNAINHGIFRITRPIESRPRQAAMMFSPQKFKGCLHGISALEVAKRRFPDLRVILFSSSRREPCVPKWVEYHRKPAQDFIVGSIFNRSSIFLCPSLSEGWGLPGAEAAACGCAVVSTDNGGVREYVQHGVTGLLSPPGNPEALAESLCFLLANEELRARLAGAGNAFVSRLSWERSADLMEDFLRRATRRPASVLLA
jgi:L-malate glycosyltransferase